MKVPKNNTKYQYSVLFRDNLVSLSVFACFISKIVFYPLNSFLGQLKLSVLKPFIIGKTWVNVYVQACFIEFYAFCSWIINNQCIFLGWSGLIDGHTTRGCGIDYGSQNSSCTRSISLLKQSEETCYCNEDLCNTGNWDRELSYLLMKITIGFQIVIKCLVV